MNNNFIVKNNRFVICISYGDYAIMHGGVNRYLIEYTDVLLSKDISIIYVYPKTIKTPIKQKTILQMYGCKIDGIDLGISVNINAIKNIVLYNEKNSKSLVDIHIQHFKDIKIKDIFLIADTFNVGIKFFLHDFYCVCVNHILLNEYEKQCSFKDCSKCRLNEAKNKHFGKYKAFFDKYSDRLHIISPSQVAKDIWISTFGLTGQVIVIPHQKGIEYQKEKKKKEKTDIIKIAYVGNDGAYKGYKYWLLATEKKPDNIEFIEYSNAKKSKTAIIKNGYFDGSNLKYMTNQIKEDEIDIVVLWSMWPETYSYTFFEAFEAGAVILANSQGGNIPYLVKQYNIGKVLEKEQLKDALQNYDYLYELIEEKNSDTKYIFVFNEELVDYIPNNKIGRTKVESEMNYKVKSNVLFSAVYKIYNWIRVKIIKI